MKTKIDLIWNSIEEEREASANLIYKRYSPDILPDVYVAIKFPERKRCLAVYTSNDRIRSFQTLKSLRGIGTELIPDSTKDGKSYFLILLTEARFKDLFSVLCEDLIFFTSRIENEDKLIEALLKRLNKWKHMFDGEGQGGLTSEEQRGLFGELVVLRKLIENDIDPVFCLGAWNNPARTLHDYQYSDTGIEVKTSLQRDNISIRISNERQLDTTLTKNIFLYHIILCQALDGGESLNDLVDYISDLISENGRAASMFRFNLLVAGYYDQHRQWYQVKSYQVVKEHIYKVTDNFPRIEESALISGVHDVQYSISYPLGGDWEVDEVILISSIKEGYDASY